MKIVLLTIMALASCSMPAFASCQAYRGCLVGSAITAEAKQACDLAKQAAYEPLLQTEYCMNGANKDNINNGSFESFALETGQLCDLLDKSNSPILKTLVGRLCISGGGIFFAYKIFHDCIHQVFPGCVAIDTNIFCPGDVGFPANGK